MRTARQRSAQRERMVESQIIARGVRDKHVLAALREVPREAFVPEGLADSAYEDRPLPIDEGQTISQPYVVALMAELARIAPGDRVLEVGAGSGYAAAVLSRIADHVHAVEVHESLAARARERLEKLGYDNVDIAVRDGSLGWEEHAPYDAILVAAGAPARIPSALREQLAPGGRLIVPSGASLAGQELLRITRSTDGEYFEEERLGAVAFVPLVGAAGWPGPGSPVAGAGRRLTKPRPGLTLADRIRHAAEPFGDIESADLTALLDRLSGSRLVLLGEASHGTSQFYRMRARITRALIEEHGFDFVAIEADWPDAAEIDAWVRHDYEDRPRVKPFQRFPRWMWGNTDVMQFVRWLRRFNEDVRRGGERSAVGFHGLDLYSMHTSIEAVLTYLEEVDPATARLARDRYSCLLPWQNDPVLYGRAVMDGSFAACEAGVVAMLNDLLMKRIEYVRRDATRFFDLIQNARLIANAEKYYRLMYRGSVPSWNLRDRHMFDTLVALLELYGPDSRGVVWAHNSHLGDASATAMSARGEHNVGQLVRERFGAAAALIGFGTHAGTVAAAPDWGEPMQVMPVLPSHPRSYERVCHDAGIDNFILHVREPADTDLREGLLEERLERAIGVVYRPETELQSHYFQACLPRQFDEWIWIDRTCAITPISETGPESMDGLPDTFPFGI